jgi:hypothetical protein
MSVALFRTAIFNEFTNLYEMRYEWHPFPAYFSIVFNSLLLTKTRCRWGQLYVYSSFEEKTVPQKCSLVMLELLQVHKYYETLSVEYVSNLNYDNEGGNFASE